MTLGELESLKVDRSTMKRKVSLIANRIKRSIQEGVTYNLNATLMELHTTYHDFQSVDEEYSAMVKEDDENKKDYEIINGLDLDQYTTLVKSIKDEAVQCYDQHIVLKLREKTQKIISRIETCLTTQAETAELVVDKEELKWDGKVIGGSK